jgi:hypothetical protein
MRITSLLSSDIAYFNNLVRAGLDGIASARNETQGSVFATSLQNATWAAAVLGAAIGVVSTCFDKDRRSVPRATIGGLVGSVVGLAGAMAWASGRFTGTATRRAMRGVNSVRDARWLERHPIDYA